MIFKLTEEQILEIIELYGGDRDKIKTIEAALNLTGLVRLEEDYYELVASVVSQCESINDQLEQCKDVEIMLERYMSLDEIIFSELNRKYENFEDKEFETQIQLTKILNVK